MMNKVRNIDNLGSPQKWSRTNISSSTYMESYIFHLSSFIPGTTKLKGKTSGWQTTRI